MISNKHIPKKEAKKIIEDIEGGNMFFMTLDHIFQQEKEKKIAPDRTTKFLWNAKMRFGKTFASYQLAKASDRIEYILTAKNIGNAPITLDLTDNLLDTLEYSTLYDRGGGELDEVTKVLTWPNISLGPDEQRTLSYVVQVDSNISAMPQGQSNPVSYDCRMTNTFGDTVHIQVDCPDIKVVEQIIDELPKTGPTENLIFAGIIASVVTFFYFRSRQLNYEVRLIRREWTAGTI